MTASEGQTILVGRTAELAELDAVVGGLQAGRGGAVLVDGEAGIGKTALLDEALRRAADSGFHVLRGACDELEGGFPLGVMARVLGVHLGLATGAEGLSGEGWSVPVLAGDPVAAGAERILGAVDGLCAHSSVVVAIDDLQWADDASLLLWRRLCRASAQLPLVLLGAARPVPVRADLDGLRRDLRTRSGRQVSVEPLSPEEVNALAERWAGGVPGPRLATRLEAVSGNPLYLKEMLDAWSRAGRLTESAGVVELTGPDGWTGGWSGGRADSGADAGASAGADTGTNTGAGAKTGGRAGARTGGRAEGRTGNSSGNSTGGITDGRAIAATGSESLAEVIEDRLDFLSGHCREVLRTASLLGAEFSAFELEGMARISPADAVNVLQEAITAGVLESVGARLRFRHGLIKIALYEAIPLALRGLLQRHAALWLIETGAAPERVAQVLLASAEAVDGWEVDWLVGQIGCLEVQAPAVAADLLTRALGHTAGSDPRHRVLQDHLAMVALHLARYEVSESTARSILTGTTDADRRGQAAWILGYTLMHCARFDDALESLGAVRAELEAASPWYARLSALYANVLVSAGRAAEAHIESSRALELGERIGDRMAWGHALHVASVECMFANDVKNGQPLLERGLAVIEAEPGLTDLRLLMQCNLAGCLIAADKPAEASVVLRRARGLAERIGAPRLALIQSQAGNLAFDQGLWDEALAEFEPVLDLPLSGNHLGNLLIARGQSAQIAVHRDDPESIAAHLDALRDVELTTTFAILSAEYYIEAKSLAFERSGQPLAAIETITAFLDKADGGGACAGILPVLLRLALVEQLPESVERALAESARRQQEQPGPLTDATVHWCRGLVEPDAQSISRAADYYRDAGRALSKGNALEDMAVLEALGGRRDAARTALAEAMAAYESLGAVWDAQRARARLRAAGLPSGAKGPRRRASTGWEALTPSERQVARLVAQNGSNSEIAERLALSRRTVETHVSHILTKLQVHSRREIVDYVAP